MREREKRAGRRAWSGLVCACACVCAVRVPASTSLSFLWKLSTMPEIPLDVRRMSAELPMLSILVLPLPLPFSFAEAMAPALPPRFGSPQFLARVTAVMAPCTKAGGSVHSPPSSICQRMNGKVSEMLNLFMCMFQHCWNRVLSANAVHQEKITLVFLHF